MAMVNREPEEVVQLRARLLEWYERNQRDPVSYTHLDVYKRQVDQWTAKAATSH